MQNTEPKNPLNQNRKNDLVMVPSTFPKFRKQNEVIVLKNKVFRIQSIARKKLILKLVDDVRNTPDGVYCMQIKKKEPEPKMIITSKEHLIGTHQ